MSTYVEIYDLAERYFSWKRDQLTELLRVQLTIAARARHPEPFKIVDFGSGDGRLIFNIVSRLPDYLRPNVHLTCVEPDESNFTELTKTFNRKAGIADVALFKGTMEEYLRSNSGTYNAALMTHMLYHFPVEQWSAELSPALARLVPGGHAFIALSQEAGSDAYLIARANMDANTKDENAIGGDYVFAEDLGRVLTGMEENFEKIPNPGSYNIPRADMDAFLAGAESKNVQELAATNIARFLGFILRREAADIAADEKLVAAFADHFETKTMIRTTDAVFKLTR